jgi:ATP-dependent Lon protease
MFMALASLMTERTVRSDTAMTGEITLRGLVPVGGVKEKILAAHRAGIKRVLLPARKKSDYDDIPEGARQQLEFIWLERVEEAVSAALEALVGVRAAGSDPETGNLHRYAHGRRGTTTFAVKICTTSPR